jgi:predicted PurR-regulated permease PerM
MVDKKSIYNPTQSRNIVLIMIVLLTIFLFMFSAHILTSLLAAAILYILFKPMFLYFVVKKHMSRGFSASLVIVTSFLVIVLPLSGVAMMVISKVAGFNPEDMKTIVDKIQHIAGSHMDLKDMLNKSLNDISKWALGAVSVFLASLARIFVSLIILYFTLFFMFKSYTEFEEALLKYLPFDTKNSMRFGKELKNMTYSNIFGQGLIALSQGIMVAVGFLIFGIPDALFWGVVSVFVCFLPVVGAPIIFIPAGIIEISNGNLTAGIGILIWGAVLITIIDNFLRQFISRKIADTHPLITIIGVIIGIPVFGIIGLVVGPFMISFLFLLFKMYEVTYLTPVKPEDEPALGKPPSSVGFDELG